MIKYLGRIISEGEIFDGEVVTDGGKIASVTKGRNASTDALCNTIKDFGGAYVAPGFIDIHVHGGGGSDFLDGTKADFVTIAALHASHGTAVMLPTSLCCPDDELFALFDLYREVANSDYDGASFAGIHLEGPYIAASQKGAQDETYLKKPTHEHYDKVLKAGKGIIRRWTIAPEVEGAMELGKRLKSEGICASIGHSDADITTAGEAVKNGYTMLTHFYSGMSTISRKNGFRIPGLVEAGYLYDGLAVEAICDGCHLPKELLQLIYKSKGASKVALITDAMRGAGSLSGETILGSRTSGQRCIIEDGVAKMPDRQAFAGSVCTTDRLLKNAYNLMLDGYLEGDARLCTAVQMLTATPASLVGLTSKGHIRASYDADLTVFDNNFTVLTTVTRGKAVYTK